VGSKITKWFHFNVNEKAFIENVQETKSKGIFSAEKTFPIQ